MEQKKILDNLLAEDFINESTIDSSRLVLTNIIPLLNIDPISQINSRKAISNIVCEEPLEEEGIFDELVNEWLHPSKQSFKERIAIVGQAQIGKTYVLKQVLKHMRKNCYNQHIFFVSLKSINLNDKMNILQLLTQQSSLKWINHQTDQDYHLFKRVVEKLQDVKKKEVCIIFDDFEQFFYKDYIYSKSIFDEMEAGYLVSNILRQWFGNAQKIILATPLQYSELVHFMEPEPLQMVYVQGLNYSGQRHLLGNEARKCFKANCGLGHACLGKCAMENHDAAMCHICKNCYENNCHCELQSLCFVPRNFLNLDRLFKNDAFQPSSPAKIVALILLQKLKWALGEDFNEKEDFQLVGKFAWDQYAKQVFVFYKSDLLRSKISKFLVNTFFSARNFEPLLQLSPYPNLVFFFSHILLQELLAALWLLSISEKDFQVQLKTHEELFLNGNFDVVCDFISEVSRNQQLQTGIGKLTKNNFQIFGKY